MYDRYWPETVAAYFNYRPHSQAVCSAVSVVDTMLITNTTVYDDLLYDLTIAVSDNILTINHVIVTHANRSHV
jgi:hypothetical protein